LPGARPKDRKETLLPARPPENSSPPHSFDKQASDRQALRAEARARRRDVHALFGPRIGPVLTANFMAAFSLPPSRTIAGYNPINEEADCYPLLTALAARGHPLCLPAVAMKDAPLCFRAWAPGDVLVKGYQDIREPAPTAAECIPDVVLVPLLAFDGVGHRLGYGGGFYDRTLAVLRAGGAVQAIGIAYAAQAVDGLPGADHDQRLDAVLTEQGVTRFEGMGRA
jgi:5-formyltetrahydrofolate cyclo-ligase